MGDLGEQRRKKMIYGSHPPAEKEESDSELHFYQQDQNLQSNSGLLRFRSAPSSLFGEFAERSSQFQSPEFSSSQPAVPFSSSSPAMVYHHHLLNHGLAERSNRKEMQLEIGGGRKPSNLSNLARRSSTPAGFFSRLNSDHGFAPMRDLSEGFRNGELGPSVGDSGSRLRNQMSFSARQSSLMSQISEMEDEELGGSSPMASWAETSLLAAAAAGDNPSGTGSREEEGSFARQLSLPRTTTAEIAAAMDKLIQFQDAVPCRIRAKRGCATHPRSIAERVRRTKISERMRKLQELVPNMDKQTNTADMLDLAVDYIKDLQREVEVLREGRASCSCSSTKQKQKQKPHRDS